MIQLVSRDSKLYLLLFQYLSRDVDWWNVVSELFESVALDSLEYRNDILPVIRQSYRDPEESANYFYYTNPRIVHNAKLLDSVSRLLFCFLNS